MAFSDQPILRALAGLLAERGQEAPITMADLAAASGASVKTVQRSIDRLSSTGVIEVRRKRRVGNRYRICDE